MRRQRRQSVLVSLVLVVLLHWTVVLLVQANNNINDEPSNQQDHQDPQDRKLKGRRRRRHKKNHHQLIPTWLENLDEYRRRQQEQTTTDSFGVGAIASSKSNKSKSGQEDPVLGVAVSHEESDESNGANERKAGKKSAKTKGKGKKYRHDNGKGMGKETGKGKDAGKGKGKGKSVDDTIIETPGPTSTTIGPGGEPEIPSVAPVSNSARPAVSSSSPATAPIPSPILSSPTIPSSPTTILPPISPTMRPISTKAPSVPTVTQAPAKSPVVTMPVNSRPQQPSPTIGTTPTTIPLTTLAPGTVPAPAAAPVAADGAREEAVVVPSYYIAFAAPLAEREPTDDEYLLIMQLTTLYFEEIFGAIYIDNASSVQFVRVNTTLDSVQFQAGIPEPEFNLYMAFETAVVFSTSSGDQLPLAEEVMAIMIESIGTSYIVDYIWQAPETPFISTQEAVLNPLETMDIVPASPITNEFQTFLQRIVSTGSILPETLFRTSDGES